WFDTGWPLVPLTCTIGGAPKGCPDRVVCRSPDTYAREAIWTLVERLKVVEMALFPARAARTVIGPDALGAKVTVVCAWPRESVRDEVGLTVAKPAGETVQDTF